jgi:YfiH family protein
VTIAPALPEGVRVVAEQPQDTGLHSIGDWGESFPWLIQGVTGRDHDMSLFGSAPTGVVVPRWQQLRDRLGCRTMVHARQVHRDTVLLHEALPAGLVIAADADGHATGDTGSLLAVSVADCVPISIVAPAARAIALLHGGWRGVAAGILERGLALLTASFPVDAADVFVHFGPAICGECFEVGAEVPAGLGIEGETPTHVDLRAVLARRAIRCGVDASRVSVSGHCTRHGQSPFYSHRGGCAERQIAVLAVRAA